MRFTLAIRTDRGEVLEFNTFGRGEYLTAVAVAREQSRTKPWVEIWDESDDRKVRVRYINGFPMRGSPASCWRDHRMSYSRHPGWADRLEGLEPRIEQLDRTAKQLHERSPELVEDRWP